MAIDYDRLPLKKDPHKAAQAKRDRLQKALDRSESLEVLARAGGRCEVWINGRRCYRSVVEVHHMLSGHGVRGIGKSALREHKQAVCRWCHRVVQDKVGVVRVGGRVPLWTDQYKTKVA